MSAIPGRAEILSSAACIASLDALAALWLIVSIWVLPTDQRLAWSNGICGLIVLILAATRAMGAYRAAGLSWFNMVIGLWVLLSPWFLVDRFESSEWNTFWTGLAIVVLATWSAVATTRYARPQPGYDRFEPPMDRTPPAMPL